MSVEPMSLAGVYQDWDRFQRGLLKAIAPLTPDQLAWPVSSNH